LNSVLKPFQDKELPLSELLPKVEAAILDLYEKPCRTPNPALDEKPHKTSDKTRCYLGTQVEFPEQGTGANVYGSREAVITVRIKEFGIASQDIDVVGTQRLNPDYVQSRIAIATRKPLSRGRLLEALQLLQLNPLLQGINAELSNTEDGQLFLKVTVQEAQTFTAQVGIDNRRSPSVGSFRRFLQVNQVNLLGARDALAVSYSNTSGSNTGDLSYTLPISPHNTTLNFSAGFGRSRVVEEPFDALDIRSRANFVELTLRHPLVQTPTQEFAMGLTLSRQFTRATLIDDEIPFPTRGSDFVGNTRLTVLRFFQEWTQGSPRSIFVARSQFSVGVPIFNITINEEPPDGRFFNWRGQVQWTQQIRLFAPDSLLLVRGDIQLADRALVPIEQFGLGGQLSVRGYRQDALLGDNGAFGSVEVRVPILRLPKIGGVLQLAPFAEVGTVWNRSDVPISTLNTLASVGLGLRFQLGDRLSARFDWGIPLVSIAGGKDTWQERGLYFSVAYNFWRR
jgi:hemolysin activation/secretion protein